MKVRRDVIDVTDLAPMFSEFEDTLEEKAWLLPICRNIMLHDLIHSVDQRNGIMSSWDCSNVATYLESTNDTPDSPFPEVEEVIIDHCNELYDALHERLPTKHNIIEGGFNCYGKLFETNGRLTLVIETESCPDE